jgi:hypothetical protein
MPAFLLPAASALAFWLGGGPGDPYLAVLLFALPCLMMLAITLARRFRFSFTGEMGLCVAACIAVLLLMLVRVSDLLRAPLFSGLAEYAVNRLNNSYLSGSIFYRLVSVGFLTVPESLRNVAGLRLGDLVMLNPVLQLELSNMLRLRLNDSLREWLPMLVVQGSLILGLFGALLCEGGRARKTGKPEIRPLFRTLHLPRRERRYMLVICIATVLTSPSDNAFTAQLCMTLYAAFSGVYQLLGAAVLVFLLCRNHPARAPLYGTLAALLYAIFPLALFVLGMADQFMHLRAAGLSHQEEE